MAASVNLAILTGLVTVAGLIALSISALMNASWRRPREMSPSLSCVALAHEGQGLLAVEVVPALLDDDRAAVAGAVARLLGVHADAAHGIRHVLEALEVGLRDVVDADLEQVLHGLHEQRLAAVGVGGVDLVLAVAGDVDVEVAREVDHVDRLAVGGDVHEHDDVGAAGVAGPGVGADDEEVGAGAGLGDLGAVGGGDRGRGLGQEVGVGDVVVDRVAEVADERRGTAEEEDEQRQQRDERPA